MLRTQFTPAPQRSEAAISHKTASGNHSEGARACRLTTLAPQRISWRAESLQRLIEHDAEVQSGARAAQTVAYGANSIHPLPIVSLLLLRGAASSRARLEMDIREIHLEFAKFLETRELQTAQGTRDGAKDSLIGFIQELHACERRTRLNFGFASVALLELLGSMTKTDFTESRAVSSAWQEVGAELNSFISETCPDMRAPHRTPTENRTSPVELFAPKLSPVERVIGFELFHQRATSAVASGVMRAFAQL